MSPPFDLRWLDSASVPELLSIQDHISALVASKQLLHQRPGLHRDHRQQQLELQRLEPDQDLQEGKQEVLLLPELDYYYPSFPLPFPPPPPHHHHWSPPPPPPFHHHWHHPPFAPPFSPPPHHFHGHHQRHMYEKYYRRYYGDGYDDPRYYDEYDRYAVSGKCGSVVKLTDGRADGRSQANIGTHSGPSFHKDVALQSRKRLREPREEAPHPHDGNQKKALSPDPSIVVINNTREPNADDQQTVISQLSSSVSTAAKIRRLQQIVADKRRRNNPLFQDSPSGVLAEEHEEASD